MNQTEQIPNETFSWQSSHSMAKFGWEVYIKSIPDEDKSIQNIFLIV